VETCEAPAQVVYDLLADLKSHLDWTGAGPKAKRGLLSMDAPTGPARVGTEFHSTGTDADGSWDDHSVVTQAERPRVFEFVTEGQAANMAGKVKFRQTVVYRYEISPRDTGSVITFVVQPTELGGEFASLAKAPIIGRLVYRLAARTMRRGPRSLATLAGHRHADRRGI